jgi:hypothetical protein
MSEDQKVVSLEQWKKSSLHVISLSSGSAVGIKIPDLAALIEAGEIPQNLLDAALSATGAGGDGRAEKTPTKEFILQEAEFSNKLVQSTVVQPKLSEANVREIPFEDRVMIVEIATRQRDLDAEGNHIGGLHKSESFRKFRGLDNLDASVENY